MYCTYERPASTQETFFASIWTYKHAMEPRICARMLFQKLCGDNTSATWICIQYNLQIISGSIVLAPLISIQYNLNFLILTSVGHMSGDLYSILGLKCLHNCADGCVQISSDYLLTLMCNPF